MADRTPGSERAATPGNGPLRVTLATDARPAAAGAVRMAATLARQSGAEIRVLRVLDPPLMYGVAQTYTLWVPDPASEEAHRNVALDELRNSLRKMDPDLPDWPTGVDYGSVPFAIVRTAEADG